MSFGRSSPWHGTSQTHARTILRLILATYLPTAMISRPVSAASAIQLDITASRPATAPSDTTPDKGTLEIKGRFVKSITVLPIDGQEQTFRLESPGTTLKLRPGEYRWANVALQDAKSPEFRAFGYYRDTFTIAAGQTTTLSIGGPLRQKLTAQPSGAVIYLRHELLGIGDEPYSRQDRLEPPQFAATQNGRRVDSGKFAYG
jgi:hypothetical protein